MGRRKEKQGEEKRVVVKCKSIGQPTGRPNRLGLLTGGPTALYSGVYSAGTTDQALLEPCNYEYLPTRGPGRCALYAAHRSGPRCDSPRVPQGVQERSRRVEGRASPL